MAREYDIAKASGTCARCGKELASGAEFLAVLSESPEGLRREDVCVSCWQAGGEGAAAGAFGVWRCRVPEPQQARRQLVDDEALMELFERLQDAEEPAKLNFRFVLALMLMRKKLLVYDGSRGDEDGSEVWTMHWKGQDARIRVIHPPLDEEKIAQAAQQLSAIFEVHP